MKIGAAMSTPWVRLLTALFIAVASPVAFAGSFMTMTASTTSGPPMTVTATGSDAAALIDDFVQQKKQFAKLIGHDSTASLSYATTHGVITVTRNAAGTSTTLSFPMIRFSKTFSATDTPTLSKAVHTYLHHQAEDALSQLSKTLAAFSKWHVVDGNPNSATAFLADDAFYRWGLPQNRDVHSGMWVTGSGETIHTEGKNGTLYAGAIGGDIPISESVALSIDFSGNVREVSGARSLTVAATTWGLPIDVYKSPLLDGFDWKLTPYVFGDLTGSKNLLQGGGVYGIGGVSSLTYRTGPFDFILGNQISYNSGINFTIDGIHYGNSHLNSGILKNGLQVVWSPGENFFVDGGIAYTNFLQDAAVKNYWTPSVGVGWHFNEATTLRVGLHGDYANGYGATGGDISLSVAF
jgi:hypothetical protein